MPWAILIACCVLWGLPKDKAWLNGLFDGVKLDTSLFGSKLTGTLSLPKWDMPALHQLVQRMPPVAAAQRQARGRAVHAQLGIGRGHRRVRRRHPLRASSCA